MSSTILKRRSIIRLTRGGKSLEREDDKLVMEFSRPGHASLTRREFGDGAGEHMDKLKRTQGLLG